MCTSLTALSTSSTPCCCPTKCAAKNPLIPAHTSGDRPEKASSAQAGAPFLFALPVRPVVRIFGRRQRVRNSSYTTMGVENGWCYCKMFKRVADCCSGVVGPPPSRHDTACRLALRAGQRCFCAGRCSGKHYPFRAGYAPRPTKRRGPVSAGSALPGTTV